MHFLERPRVHREDADESVQLAQADGQRRFVDVPLNAFGAWRLGQRAGVGPVTGIGWEKAAGIHEVVDFLLRAGGCGQVLPERSDGGIGEIAVLAEEHGEHGHFAVGAASEEVRFHVGKIAVDRVLAGVMEGEVLQVIADAADNHEAAGHLANDDGVAIVDERDRTADEVQLDRLQRRIEPRAANIYRRLLAAFRACAVSLIELAPVEGPVFAGVSPRTLGGRSVLRRVVVLSRN